MSGFRSAIGDASWPEALAVLVTLAILLYGLGWVASRTSWSKPARVGAFSALALVTFTVFAGVILYIG